MINIRLKPVGPEDALDPAKIRFGDDYVYLENLAVRLFAITSKGLFEGQLARDFEFNETRTALRIRLREARFSDGRLITAQDVARTIKRAILLGSPHSEPRSIFLQSGDLKDVDGSFPGIEIISERELRLHFAHKVKEILYYLHLADYGILTPEQSRSKALLAKDWISATSGAFRLAEINGRLALKRNEGSLLDDDRLPPILNPVSPNSSALFAEIQANRIQLGTLKFSEYSQNAKAFASQQTVSLFGSPHDGIAFIALNLRSPKFRSQQTRQWLLKRALASFTPKGDFADLTKKAHQFFLPGARGYLPETELAQLLPSDAPKKIPEELRGGITLRTTPGMREYMPPDLEAQLTQVFGFPVHIAFDMDPKAYIREMGDRQFDAHLMATSMSYKVLGESLNLAYTSESPTFLDPRGTVRRLLKAYQQTDEPEGEATIIKQILTAMAQDAECVPLYYFPSPDFISKETFDLKLFAMDESFPIWRLRVRSK